MGKLTQIFISRGAVSWAGSCISLLPFHDSPPWDWSGDRRRVVPTWQFHKLLMGFRLCVVHHLLFEYKDPTFTLWKKLVLAFCFLPRSCSWAQRGASKVSLKSHLSLFGAAGEGGAAVGGESSVPGEVLVGMASQLHLSKCTHSLWPKQREFGTAGWTPQLSLRVALMEVSGALRRHQWPCVEQLDLQGLMPLTAQFF